MELSIFVQTVLLEIARGVNNANVPFGDAPPFTLMGGTGGTIDFEIHTFVEEQEASKKKGSLKLGVVKVLTVGGDLGSESAQIDRSTHIIRFRVRPAERSYFEIQESVPDA